MGLGLSKDDADKYYQAKGTYVSGPEFAAYAYMPQGDWKYKCKNLAYDQAGKKLGYMCQKKDGSWIEASKTLDLKDCDMTKITLGEDGGLACQPPPATPPAATEYFRYRRAVQWNPRQGGEPFRYLHSSNRKESLFL